MAAYTFRSVGTTDSASNASITPGAPAGAQVGDQLRLFTGTRTVGATLSTPPSANWTLLALNDPASQGLAVYAKIADGTADDTPTIQWTGTVTQFAWIEAWHGDVYAGDLRTLVTNIVPSELGSQAAPILPALGVSGADRQVIVFAFKNKSATSNDATTITPPAGFTLRNQFIGTGNSVAAASATLQQTTAADFAGADFTINGTADSLSTTGIAFAIRTTTGGISTIVPDAVSEDVRTDTSTPRTWSHPGGADCNAVVLRIMHGTSSTDHVSAASYGGVAMTRQKRNIDTATEAGAAEIWTLLSGVPTGTQTVSYTPGATTDDIHAVCETFKAPQALTVVDTDGIDENVANPSVTLQTGGKHCIAVGALYSGLGAVGNVVPNEDCITVHDHDLGNFISSAIRSTISSTADQTLGYTASTDDVAFAAVLLGYTAGGINRQMMAHHG